MSASTRRVRGAPRSDAAGGWSWRVAALASGVVLGMAGGVAPARAASYDLGRRLELLPAARWMEACPAGVSLGAAQPVAGLPARSAALAFTDRPRGHVALALELASLRAAAVNEVAGAVQARAQGAGLALGARLEAVQMTVGAIERRQHARGAVWAILGGSWLEVGAHWEGPRRDSPGLPPSQVEWCARAALPNCAISVVRTSSRYGLEASWRLGLRVRLVSGLALGLRAGAGESELVSSVRVARGGVTVALPVASRIGAGIALGLSFTHGDLP